MRRALLAYRLFVFGIFIVCNAIIASVAVWNLSIGPTEGPGVQVVQYMIFLGAFGLALVFPLIFVEVSRKNAMTKLVWFECLWVGLFWIMELSGAAALSAIVPDTMCISSSNTQTPANTTTSDPTVVNAVCTSAHVLLAFAWICAIFLLIYLLVLVISAISIHTVDPDVWRSNVAKVDWCKARQALASAPSSPRFMKTQRAPSLVAPQPRRVVEISPMTGASSAFSVECHKPPLEPARRDNYVAYAPQPPPPVAALAPLRGQRDYPTPLPAAPPSLYPQHMQSVLPAPSRTPPQPIPRPTQASPPPLGEWPRRDAMKAPKVDRSARKLPPVITDMPGGKQAPPSAMTNSATPLMQHSASASYSSAAGSPYSASSMPNTFSSRSRPGGPRKRSNSSGEWKRPPPLDLSKISAYRDKGKSGS